MCPTIHLTAYSRTVTSSSFALLFCSAGVPVCLLLIPTYFSACRSSLPLFSIVFLNSRGWYTVICSSLFVFVPSPFWSFDLSARNFLFSLAFSVGSVSTVCVTRFPLRNFVSRACFPLSTVPSCLVFLPITVRCVGYRICLCCIQNAGLVNRKRMLLNADDRNCPSGPDINILYVSLSVLMEIFFFIASDGV